MRAGRLFVPLALAALLGCDSPDSERRERPTGPLRPGTVLHAELASWESHRYPVDLAPGDALHAVVFQQGVDVELGLETPDGTPIVLVDSPNGDRGFEALWAVAEHPGAHQLRVTQVEKHGGYELHLEKLGPANAADRLRAEAQRLARGDNAALERAVEIWRQTGDRYQEALAHLRLGRAERAREHLLEALDRFRTALRLLEGQGQDELRCGLWNDIADARYAQRELPQAISAASTALRIARASDYVPGIVVALSNLALYQQDRNRFAAAIELYDEALEAAQKAGTLRQKALVLHNLGQLYSWLGRLPEARDRLSEALVLLRREGSSVEQATTCLLLGWIDYQEGDYESAETRYLEALERAQHAGRRFEQAAALDRLGTLYRTRGQLDLAEHAYQRALSTLSSQMASSAAIETTANLGALYLAMDRPRAALVLLERALAGYTAIEDKSARAATLTTIARAHDELRAPETALARLEEALAIIEDLRLGSADYSLRESLLALRREPHEVAIDLLMTLDARNPAAGHAARAFAISEQARARSLLDMLHEARSEIRRTADPKLLALADQLTDQLAGLELDTSAFSASEDLAREKRRLAAEYERVEAQIRSSSPAFHASEPPEPVGPEQIQALLDDDTLVLAYTLSSRGSFLWLLDHSSLQGFRLPVREEIERVAREYRQRLNQRSRNPALARQLDQSARELSRELLGPVASRLGRRRLVFVLDGELQALAFSALPQPSQLEETEPAPLLADHEVCYLPSASVLSVLRRRLSERPPAAKTVAIFADAVYSLDDARYFRDTKPQDGACNAAHDPTRAAAGGWDLGPLPGSRREAEAIRHIVGPELSWSALGFDASRETLLATDFRGFRILHLAAHGRLDDNPWFSGIALSLYDERARRRNGLLTLHEIHQLDLPVELVVLSACETALGKLVRGEGVIGLPRGLLYAGAARVVVSLWKVHDEATAQLMTFFYRELLQDPRAPAAALRAAQLKLREDPRWRSPRHWAGFVLLGAW